MYIADFLNHDSTKIIEHTYCILQKKNKRTRDKILETILDRYAASMLLLLISTYRMMFTKGSENIT